MKRRIPIRILSLFLVLALLMPNFQPAFATETADVTEPTSAVVELPQETEAPAESEEIVETDPIETEPVETEPVETEPVETEPVETEPVETEPVETEPVETEPVETEPVETEPVEETEPEEAPLFPGLPEDYVLSEEAIARKAELMEEGLLEKLANMTEGKDYVAGHVNVHAASEEDAAIIAAAFGGELMMFSNGYALIQLVDATVIEAVEAGMDPEQHLPAVMPSYCYSLTPVEVADFAPYAAELPKEQSWYSWVRENMTNPDPVLLDPRGTNYQWMHDAVDTYAAWGVTVGDPWVKVAVLDTGVNSSHEDLAGKVTNINVRYNGSYLGTSDNDGHGTHVAGIIAASMDNGKGGAGIAPGVSILNVRVFDSSGNCNDWYIAEGIRAAVAAGAHIINMSLGGSGTSWMLEDAIDYAVANDVTVIAAMGNVGTNSLEYPAACDGVIAVCATDSSNSRAFFSNYGAWADISAPGQGIYSSVNTGGYAIFDGTSMAAPVVAGVAALYTSAMGDRVDPAVMEKALESSATKISGASGMGAGIVNAAKMLDDKPDAPVPYICDDTYEYNPKGLIPANAKLFLFESEAALDTFGNTGVVVGDQSSVLIFTMDGTNPSVKNGEVINGEVLQDPMYIDLSYFAGTTVTVKAALVSGMGMVGKTLTLKLKVDTSNAVTGITITGPQEMVAGTSTTFSATVAPADTADQSVTWSIVDADYSMYSAKIDAKTGKLTTPKSKSGQITIRATSNANYRYFKDHTVNVRYINPVATMMLNRSSHTSYTGYYFTLSIYRMEDTYGRSISPSLAGVKWTSSNPKVAEVTQDGRVYCHTKGTVTITCQALDGSNKKATCKVTVKIPVESIEITGPTTIAPGGSATYKATVSPKTASNKKVDWVLVSGPRGTTVSTSGKLTVPTYASYGSTITLRAVAQDDLSSVAYDEITIKVHEKCNGVYIGCFSSYYKTGYAVGPNVSGELLYDNTYGSLKRVKSVTLFSLDLKHGTTTKDKQLDNALQLTSCFSYPRGANVNPTIEWSSSNPSVATVSSNGYVVAHKAGTAKITCAALDGSNKKATITVTVTNPASTISISTSAPRMLNNDPYLAFGKSATNKAVFADTYGNPTNQKVNWSFSVYEVFSDGSSINRTSYFQRNKLVTLSSSGKLSVSSKLYDEWNHTSVGEFMVNVYATAADGTGAQGRILYRLIPPTTYIKTSYSSYSADGNSSYYIDFYSDQWPLLGESFTVTSSNPKVLSIVEPAIVYRSTSSSTGLSVYRLYFYAGQPGTAKVTIKAADGSNKSHSFSVRVY